MKYLIAFLATLACFLAPRSLAAIVPQWSTGVAVPGEKVVLYLIDMEGQSGDPISLPKPPEIPHASVRLLQTKLDGNPLDPNRAIVAIAPVMVTPDAPGLIEPGTLEVTYASGRKAKVEVPPLPVVSTSDIKWQEKPFTYGALWYVGNKDGYVNEPVRASLKLFLPQDIVAPHQPMLEGMGVSVLSFQPSVQGVASVVQGEFIPKPTAFAKGQTWRTADFMGEFTPEHEGKQGVRAAIPLMQVTQSAGFTRTFQTTVPLPSLELSALPLPPGAPADFADTVGEYTVEASTTAKDLAMYEAVEVTITVRGTGNLGKLECPVPEDAEDWRLIPSTRKPLLDSNGQTVGMAFSQLMRPTAEVPGIPAFSFSYFDPKAMEYRRAESRPIPLPWRATEDAAASPSAGAAAPPPAGDVPVAEMRDIYGNFDLGNAAQLSLQLPRSLWYLLYLPALAIVLALAVGSLRRRLAAGAEGRARERELARIGRTASGLDFLKALGGFIESHIPMGGQTPELQQILARRDEEAFRPEASVSITPAEKAAMLRQVRRALAKLATTAALLLLALAPSTWAAGDDAYDAYEKGQYSSAREILEAELKAHPRSADRALEGWGAYRARLLFNLGNCHYRLGQPGQAALCYARALQEDPQLKEAALNLAFVQRQQGAILPEDGGAQAVFTFFTPQQLWVGTIAATALLVLCLALHLAWRGRPRPWLHTATALALLLSLACAANWVYYLTRATPDFHLLPPANVVYAVQPATARSAPVESAAEVIRITPTSPLLLLAERGSMSYVETATGTRGWVATETLAPLCAEGAVPRMPLTLCF